MSENKDIKNVHSGHRDRMRAKLLKRGIDAFDDHEILEFLLFYVNKRKNTNPTGHKLMEKFKTLSGVFDASFEELCSVDGVGEAGASLLRLVGQLPNRLSAESAEKKIRLVTNRDAAEYCMQFLKGLDHERMLLISLNSVKDVLAVDIVSDGTFNATNADVRKILELAFLRKATGVILAHNHPGDSPHPSASDTTITAKITGILEGINIAVIDHIICSDDSYCSMSERGIMDMFH